MNRKTIVSIASTLIVTAGMAQNPHIWDDPNAWSKGLFVYTTTEPKYSANELALDLFGSYLNPEPRLNKIFDSNIRHGSWGGGAGLNYFLTPNLGLGGDVDLSDHPGRIVDQVLGDVTLRLPIVNTGLAPYIIGSGGRGISPIWQWVYGGGVGVEYRFNPELGVYADTRYLWGDQRFDRLLFRAGFRILF